MVEETCVISATRNADLTFDTEKFEDREEDFRQLMTKMLKKRANQAIVRLELGQKPSQTMMDLLTGMIPVVTGQVYYDSSPLAMGYVSQLEKLLPEELRAKLTYVPYQPRWPENLNRQESMIDQIRRRDRLLFFPFDSIDPFLKLLEEAADCRTCLHQDHHLPSRPPPPRSLGSSAGQRQGSGGPHGAPGLA